MCKAARGVTLVGTLVALLVLGLGLLALTRLQPQLQRGVADSGHRLSALQLARQKIEQLRAADRLPLGAAGIAAGGDAPVQGGSTFERHWTSTSAGVHGERFTRVRVAWQVRSAARSEVELSTFLYATERAGSGRLTLPKPVGGLWRGEARHADVPSLATESGGTNRGRSTMPWAGSSGGYIVFDDATGIVIAQCASSPSNDTALPRSCTFVDKVLIQGYVSGTVGDAVSVRFELGPGMRGVATPECVLYTAVRESDGAPIAGLWRYRCLIQPADEDSSPTTPPTWSGRLDFVGLASNVSVCRYGRPETYTRASGSLDHQNVLLVEAAACPLGASSGPDL